MGFTTWRAASRKKGALGVAVLAALAVPGAADARTKTVEVGPFTQSAQQRFQQATADANAFFRRVVTIRRGDRVRWDINGFHTVTFVPRGGPMPGLITPDTANPVAGVNDFAGAPFWFNDQPNLIFNPLVAFPQGGKTFKRNRLQNSGLPLQEGPPEPYRLRFRRKGTFRYFCIVHPGMSGKVRVVGRRARVPSARKDRKQAKREQKTLLQRAQRRTNGTGTGSLTGILQAGNDDRRGTAIFKFFPAQPSYRVGDVVTLRMPPRSTEDHTFTFGPADYTGPLAEGLIRPAGNAIVFDPRGAYPSEEPGSVPSITPTLHGNGFFNSGVMDSDPDTPPPDSMQVRFDAAGTYSLLCLIHPFMTGTVTVTP